MRIPYLSSLPSAANFLKAPSIDHFLSVIIQLDNSRRKFACIEEFSKNAKKPHRVALNYLLSVREASPKNIKTRDLTLLNQPFEDNVYLWMALIETFDSTGCSDIRGRIVDQIAQHLNDLVMSRNNESNKATVFWLLTKSRAGRSILRNHPAQDTYFKFSPYPKLHFFALFVFNFHLFIDCYVVSRFACK